MTDTPLKKDTRFAKGNAGGPGRPPLPPEVKAARRLNKTEFEAVVNKYLWMPLIDLKLMASDQSLPAMESWMVSIIVKGITTGDWGGNEWLAQRMIGKVTEHIEVSQPKPFVIRHTNGEQTVLGAEVKKLGEGDE